MKFVYPGFNKVFDTQTNGINTIIIENPHMFSDLCIDINDQIQGKEGKAVVSNNDIPLDMGKYVEFITQFVPFDINKRGLLSKISATAERLAVEPDYYEATMTEIANLEKYLWSITENMEGAFAFPKLNIGNVIKSTGIEIEDDYNSLGEKIIDYMELVRAYDRDKLFVFVNMCSYIDRNECTYLMDTIIRKGFHVIMIENCEREICSGEIRYIVDKDYCEIE